MKKINYLLIGLAIIVASTSMALAIPNPPGTGVPPIQQKEFNLQDVYNLVPMVFNWAFWIFTVYTVAMVLKLAFDFIKSGGKTEMMKTLADSGKNIVIGIVLAIIAKSVPYIISSFIGS